MSDHQPPAPKPESPHCPPQRVQDLIAALERRGLTFTLDAPLDPSGPWWFDLSTEPPVMITSYADGYAVDARSSLPFEGHDERWITAEAAAQRAQTLLREGWPTLEYDERQALLRQDVPLGEAQDTDEDTRLAQHAAASWAAAQRLPEGPWALQIGKTASEDGVICAPGVAQACALLACARPPSLVVGSEPDLQLLRPWLRGAQREELRTLPLRAL